MGLIQEITRPLKIPKDSERLGVSPQPAGTQLGIIPAQFRIFLELEQFVEQKLSGATDVPCKVPDYGRPGISLVSFAVKMPREPHATKAGGKPRGENHLFGEEFVDRSRLSPVFGARFISIEKAMAVVDALPTGEQCSPVLRRQS